MFDFSLLAMYFLISSTLDKIDFVEPNWTSKESVILWSILSVVFKLEHFPARILSTFQLLQLKTFQTWNFRKALLAITVKHHNCALVCHLIGNNFIVIWHSFFSKVTSQLKVNTECLCHYLNSCLQAGDISSWVVISSCLLIWRQCCSSLQEQLTLCTFLVESSC